MAGGTWNSQNKLQPGVYINVISRMAQPISIGDRGIVAIAKELSWGPEGEIVAIKAGDDFTPMVGYDQTHEKALFLREMFKGSERSNGPVKVFLYRLKGIASEKAKGKIGGITVEAKYPGSRGNDIFISVSENPDKEGEFEVETIVDGLVKDSQVVKQIAELKANAWVVFSGEEEVSASVGMPLTGGKDGTINPAAHSEFLSLLESYLFHVLIYDGTDKVVQTAYISFIQRMRNRIGRKCQVVMAEIEANSEAVISVANGVVLTDGTTLTPQQATWWVGGAEAGANYNQSLVYAQYPQATDAHPRLTGDQVDEALAKGQIVFFEEFGSVKMVSDNNTLVTYSPEKGEAFSFNQVIRIVDSFANDTYQNFSKNYIGKTQNNETGRDLLKAWICGYLNEMQANGGIQSFTSDDVLVEAGEALNSVVIHVAIQPVVAIEKIYITATLTDE